MTSLLRKPGTGPVTLTRGQFGQTAAGQKPGASYTGYLAYINRRRAAKLGTTSADPFAPTSPQDINATINRYTGMYGTPQTDAQIQTQAQGLIDPIVAAVTGNINTRAKEASGAIGANSAALAKQLGSVDYGAPYAGAKLEQAAVDAALREGLAGGGAQLAGDLQSRLGQIADPTVGAAAGQVAAQGVAAGNTELARGSNALSSLIARAAAAKEYGAKLPGIAQLTGLQDIAGVQRDATNQVGDQTTEISKLLPSIVQNFRSENANLRGNKAQAAAQLYGLLTGQNVTKATAKAGLANTSFDNSLAAQNAATDAAYKAAEVGIAQQNADASTTRAKAAAARTTKTGLTPGKQADIAKSAAKDAEDLYHGVTKPNASDPKNPTVVSYTQTYQDAIKTLTARYPSLTPQQIVSLANRWYKPGEFGRPLKTVPLPPKITVKSKTGLGATVSGY